jgi:hypothetical protein
MISRCKEVQFGGVVRCGVGERVCPDPTLNPNISIYSQTASTKRNGVVVIVTVGGWPRDKFT